MTSARRLLVASIIVSCCAAASLTAQVAEPGSIYRVFLSDGHALPAYGESARVGDRLVFTLFVGQRGEATQLQLMSLPVAAIDLEKTERYAASMRAAHYAATRGEADYAAMTNEVQRALGQLGAIADPIQRLTLAEEAKRRLFDWSRENHSYRAADIRELGALFDEVIGELRAAAGESRFSLDLRAGPAAPDLVPLLGRPTLPEAIALALAASRAADVFEDRAAVLRTALAALEHASDAEELRAHVRAELDAELAADNAYGTLVAESTTRAVTAMRAGDVAALLAVRAAVIARDQELGRRRPAHVSLLLAELDERLERARAHRLALDHYAVARRGLLRYERRIRPTLSGLDGLAPVLKAIETMQGTAYERLEAASDRLKGLASSLRRITPPPDAAGVHATLVSAVHLAEQACARRRLAVTSLNVSIARDASAAAAGAGLLAAQARATLVERLFPPRIE